MVLRLRGRTSSAALYKAAGLPNCEYESSAVVRRRAVPPFRIILAQPAFTSLRRQRRTLRLRCSGADGFVSARSGRLLWDRWFSVKLPSGLRCRSFRDLVVVLVSSLLVFIVACKVRSGLGEQSVCRLLPWEVLLPRMSVLRNHIWELEGCASRLSGLSGRGTVELPRETGFDEIKRLWQKEKRWKLTRRSVGSIGWE